MRRSAILALVLLGLATGVWAQTATGNIYGTVTDESGAALPGASITLTGPTIGGLTTTSGPQGEFRFLRIDHASYTLSVSLKGFTTVRRDVIVATGVNVTISFGLKVATVEESVTVTAETPAVDIKRQGTASTFSREELADIPNGRDPWVVLRQTPGVIVDRVNIAGNESGQQANFAGKGSRGADAMWNLDGVPITDMAATGSSTYYDFDAFDEINITTGGSDLKVQSGGIALNFVTKRGTNNFHGSLRGIFSHDKSRDSAHAGFESSNLPAEIVPCTATSAAGTCDARLNNSASDVTKGFPFARDKADHIEEVGEGGAELGGPIVKDKLWFWGSYARQDIRLQRLSGTRDRTVLKDINGKINFQASQSDMISAFYFLGTKEKYGRATAGTGLQESDQTLADQGGVFPSGPHGFYKIEDNHIFSPNFYVDAKYSYWGTGFGFTPRGNSNLVENFITQTATGSTFIYKSLRPQHTLNVDGTYFTSGAGGGHELKFGFSFKKATVNSTSIYSGDQIIQFYRTTGNFVRLTRAAVAGSVSKYWSGYVGDTFTKDRLTLNVGVRFDHQTGSNLPATAPANPLFPELLPALVYDGAGPTITWNDVSPRVGFTYALDASRKTILRASFARYAGQLGSADVQFASPLGNVSILEYRWNDLNNDGVVQKNEVLTSQGTTFSSNVDPAHPTALSSVNTIDPNYKANHDLEVIGGIDHELIADLAVGVAYTYRHSTDFVYYPFIGITSADYVPRPAVTANGYTTGTYYALPDAKAAAVSGGQTLTNRPDYARNFNGLEATLLKRLSNKWQARVAFSYNNWTEHVGPGSYQNPTPFVRSDAFGSTSTPNPKIEGGQVLLIGSGSGKTLYYTAPKWQLNASALYQLPAGFEVSGNLFGREGYPRPIFINADGGGLDGTLRILSTPTVNTVKLANLWNLDLRLAKTIKLGGTASFNLFADCFNVFNASTELNRVDQANSAAFVFPTAIGPQNRLDEILNPRIFRFGVRLGF